MARKKQVEAAQESAATGDVFDQAIAAQQATPVQNDPAEMQQLSSQEPNELPAPAANAQEKKLSWQPRPVITEALPDGSKVKLIDGYNAGVDITIEHPDLNFRPSQNVLEPIKERHEGRNTPRYNQKHWHKKVRNNPITERLDMEDRHAEAVKRRKEELAQQEKTR
ncbi:MAG: hypothetical protein JO112_15090 [Planctomycetes bacterium]|nr:hypothetical protein [Planctomycetota bacterium]